MTTDSSGTGGSEMKAGIAVLMSILVTIILMQQWTQCTYLSTVCQLLWVTNQRNVVTTYSSDLHFRNMQICKFSHIV